MTLHDGRNGERLQQILSVRPSESRAERLEKIGDLGVDLGGIGDGPGDFFAKDLAIPAPKPVSGDLDGPLAHSQRFADLLVGFGQVVSFEHGRSRSNRSDLPLRLPPIPGEPGRVRAAPVPSAARRAARPSGRGPARCM